MPKATRKCTWKFFVVSQFEDIVNMAYISGTNPIKWFSDVPIILDKIKWNDYPPSPPPPKQWWGYQGGKTRYSGIILTGGGVVQMFHLFCLGLQSWTNLSGTIIPHPSPPPNAMMKARRSKTLYQWNGRRGGLDVSFILSKIVAKLKLSNT